HRGGLEWRSAAFLLGDDNPLDLHSFPTRRSSDLGGRKTRRPANAANAPRPGKPPRYERGCHAHRFGWAWFERPVSPCPRKTVGRSEEHTSELQSRRELVCRLLLEQRKSGRTAAGN